MKKILLGLGLLILLGILFFSFWSADLPLLSPFWRPNRPDLTDKLSQRLGSSLVLDFSQAGKMETLAETINYLVFNPKTGQVYAAKNEEAGIAPASFTKLLTAMVALDVATPSAQIKASEESVNKEPTILELKVGEELTVSELIRGAIVTSANDAAAVLAEGVALFYGQKPDFFIDLLNQKAALLGMTQSHFANPEGYDDPNQFSTLKDIAKLSAAVLEKYPEIRAVAASDRDDILANSFHGKYYLPNWNGLLGVYPGVEGLKIAYTETAGYSTIVTAVREDVRVVVILTGADSIRERDLAAAGLLDMAYIAEKIKPANISRNKLDRRYKEWADLATQIRAEIMELEKNER